ncbi:MAG TPA: hypothetical protein VGC85_11005 [Chthoniobacterales bacterium]
MKSTFAILLFAFGLLSNATRAQSPAPVVVQAIVPGKTSSGPTAPAIAAPAADSSAVLVKALQQIKAQNEEILAKQAAALQQLEEMEKGAEQLRIYNKRG